MQDQAWIFMTLGFFGALLTSTSWVPQIIKGWQTRRLDDLSWLTLSAFCVGSLCWLAYGLFKEDWLIIGANAFIICCILSLMAMKASFSAGDRQKTGSSAPD